MSGSSAQINLNEFQSPLVIEEGPSGAEDAQPQEVASSEEEEEEEEEEDGRVAKESGGAPGKY